MTREELIRHLRKRMALHAGMLALGIFAMFLNAYAAFEAVSGLWPASLVATFLLAWVVARNHTEIRGLRRALKRVQDSGRSGPDG